MTGNFKKIVAQRRWLRIVWTFKARTAATQWVLAKDWVLQINENRLVRGQSLNIPFYGFFRYVIQVLVTQIKDFIAKNSPKKQTRGEGTNAIDAS